MSYRKQSNINFNILYYIVMRESYEKDSDINLNDDTKEFLTSFIEKYNAIVREIDGKSKISQLSYKEKATMYSTLLTLFPTQNCFLYSHINDLLTGFTYKKETTLINDAFKLSVYIDDEE